MAYQQQEHRHGHGHDHQDDAHKLGLLSSGQDDQQGGHEKTSVLKKVKVKAKKLKDTIKKHGHGHGDDQAQHHDHQYVDDDDMEFDEGEDEDEELVQDPEVHGAPIYESTGMRNADISSSRPKGTSGEHDGGATPLQSAHLPVGEVKNKTEQPYLSSAVLEDLKEDPDAPKHGGAQPLPGNYESKVTDPTGQNRGEACGVNSSVVQSLDRMIERETKPALAAGSPGQSTLPTSTGSHDQFSQELSRPSTTVITESKEYPVEENQGGGGGGGYTEKLSGVTSALAGTAISAKNGVAAKLGYGEQKHNNEEEGHSSSIKRSNDDLKAGAAHDSSGKVSSVAAAVADKAINAKNVVASKLLGYNMEGTGPESEEKAKEAGLNSNINTGMGSWAEKLKPGEEHKALSEMIRDVLHISKKPNQEEQPPPAAAANKKSVKERVSDGLHKRDKEEEKEKKPSAAVAKVTDSEQVARRLGTEDEKSEDQSHAEKTLADTIKSTVSSWWRKNWYQNPFFLVALPNWFGIFLRFNFSFVDRWKISCYCCC